MMDAGGRDILSLERAENGKFVKADIFERPVSFSVESHANVGSPEESMISEELFAIYVKALDRLPERCREVFIRIREEKQSYAQVAEELGISTKTVDAQLQKATIRLKEAISMVNNDR